jgi:hypothetical protein
MADARMPLAGTREEDILAALSPTFGEPAFVNTWVLPARALGDAWGPTCTER